MKQKIKAKGHYTYEYISKVKGQGRQYRHTADLDLGPGSGLCADLPQLLYVNRMYIPNQLQYLYNKLVLV